MGSISTQTYATLTVTPASGKSVETTDEEDHVAETD
jgi:hypothetical protein